VALRIRVGDPPAEHLDRHQDRGQGVVQFMDDLAEIEAWRGGGSGQEDGHRPEAGGASPAGAIPATTG
jgi:hypothetical protein